MSSIQIILIYLLSTKGLYRRVYMTGIGGLRTECSSNPAMFLQLLF